MEVHIEQEPSGKVKVGTKVKLTATATPANPVTTFAWTLATGGSSGDATYEFTASTETAGDYSVTATGPGDPAESATQTVKVEVVEEAAEQAAPFIFRPGVAVLAGIVIVAVFFAALSSTMSAISDFTWTESDSVTSSRAVDVGGVIGLVLLLIGALVLAVGLWMAVVEFAGRFRKSDKGVSGAKGATEDVPKIIEALGKLKGVALVLVIACIPLLAAAYVARGGIEQSPTPTTTTTTTTTTAADQ